MNPTVLTAKDQAGPITVCNSGQKTNLLALYRVGKWNRQNATNKGRPSRRRLEEKLGKTKSYYRNNKVSSYV